ncbi:MAG: phytanoyl-CoA dioxygenase family protein [Candidatus Poribacteria bacterium]|nr:phytanoyl-CoA dioxygenase family protein [Candidatus Poribacteria bacterium]
MEHWTSCKNKFDLSPDKFGELRSSNDLLTNPDALRQRVAEDGYLLLRRFLDKNKVRAARNELLVKMARNDSVDDDYLEREGVDLSLKSEVNTKSFREGDAVRALTQGGEMMAFYDQFFAEPARALDFIWVRMVSIGAATGCHFDWVYMGRGSKKLHTSWTPLIDVPKSGGALAVLKGSHQFSELISTYGSIDVDDERSNKKFGGWYTQDPLEVQNQFGGQWQTTDFEVGDLLIFSMHTMHCSLDNRSSDSRIRLTLDTRYQPASEPADERWIGDNPIAHSPTAKRR